MKHVHQNNTPNWVERMQEDDVVINRVSSKEENLKKLRQRLDADRKRKILPWYMLAAAASIVLFFFKTLFMTTGGDAGLKRVVTSKPMVNKIDSTVIVQKNIKVNKKMTDVKIVQPIATISDGISKKHLRPVIAKKNSMPLVAKDSVNDIVNHGEDVIRDITSVPHKLPRVHINDITTKEPLPANTSTQGLTIKKMIRLFNIDMTGGEPVKSQKIPPNQYTIPNNQN